MVNPAPVHPASGVPGLGFFAAAPRGPWSCLTVNGNEGGEPPGLTAGTGAGESPSVTWSTALGHFSKTKTILVKQIRGNAIGILVMMWFAFPR